MKRYAFSRRTRFRFVELDGSDAGDFEIERRTPNDHVIATSLEQGAERTFALLEGFFSRLNRQLLRALPGTTSANVFERGDYDPAQHACLSLGALEEMLVLFCVDYYPQRFKRHLGGRPIDLWRNDPIVRDGLVPSYPPSADDLRIQEIVEREWSTTRRSRSRQVLARWLNQQGGSNVVRSVKLAEQALEEATRTDGPR